MKDAVLRSRLALLLSFFATGCLTPKAEIQVALPAAPIAVQVEPQTCSASEAWAETSSIAANLVATATIAAAVLEEEEASEEGSDVSPEDLAEAESSEVDPLRAVTSTGTGVRYTAEISDEELERLWRESPEKLGSISIGFADEGRVINAAVCPASDKDEWMVVSPHKAFATQESIDYVLTAIRRVKELHPHAPPLRINNMSGPEGGYLRPHKSHQSGRDVDLAFYYPTAEVVRTRAREKAIDVPLNWALVKALVTLTDVEVIWVDYRVQKVLYDYALTAGEDQAWLDSLFNAGRNSLIKHARRHRDHFHVRFYNARAQELGRRVAPLLAQRPDQNQMMVRVKNGDTLGHIAMKYNSGVSAIMKANRMRSTFLRIGQVLRVPLRGPCTRCPIPPPVEVPARRLPPPEQTASITGSGGAESFSIRAE